MGLAFSAFFKCLNQLTLHIYILSVTCIIQNYVQLRRCPLCPYSGCHKNFPGYLCLIFSGRLFCKYGVATEKAWALEHCRMIPRQGGTDNRPCWAVVVRELCRCYFCYSSLILVSFMIETNKHCAHYKVVYVYMESEGGISSATG